MTNRQVQSLAQAASLVALLLMIVPGPPARADEPAPPPLWQIGSPDGTPEGFALAPTGYRDYQHDAFFIVGQSNPAQDWPYVHPGPIDAWAGSTGHAFRIAFAVKGCPEAGAPTRLVLDLADTQSQQPPRLGVSLNTWFENENDLGHDLPPGGGDASINGRLDHAKRHRLEIHFPPQALRDGVNFITIGGYSGSWLLYDAVSFYAPAGIELVPVQGSHITAARALPVLKEKDGKLFQVVRATVQHFDEPMHATLTTYNGADIDLKTEVDLTPGPQELEVLIPERDRDTPLGLKLERAADRSVSFDPGGLKLTPAKKMTVYILPHSHTDIGYTEVQSRIEQKQVDNLLAAIAAAKQTAGYPEGARFVWNVEVLWAADLYLNRLNDTQRADFLQAVRDGQVSLQGMYLNELTGLCRPEELLRLFRYATRLAEQTGVPIDSAMISDVPGYTWGTVTAMNHAGIRYFSTAPNFFDRIGDILVQWENKPFYWIGPDGQSQVLVWIPLKGYAMSHLVQQLSPQWAASYLAQLDQTDYPYDIAYIRWSGHGDNAVPEPAICDFVRDWKAQYAWPKFVIASTSTAFQAFEQQYGDTLPRVRGDWTPYWEDGAGSSALETGLNRASSDRLTQAEALWAMLDPARYPVAAFDHAWKNVLLYSEHTWGAFCSVTEPASPFTQDQWLIKQSFATAANRQSQALVVHALDQRRGAASPEPGHDLDLFNTTSWPRSEVVVVPRGVSEAGHRVRDDQGRGVPSQRLASGDLALQVSDLPPFAGRRFTLTAGEPEPLADASPAVVEGATLRNGLITVRVDEQTGGIVELTAPGVAGNLVDPAAGHALNDYLYLIGDDVSKVQTSGPVTITVRDRGPLVASLWIESQPPGCHLLRREVRLVAGSAHVELINTVDKKRLEAPSYMAREGKESLNFAFPFHVPGGTLRLDLPLAVIRPEADQMPSACKNWLTIGRFAEIAGTDSGLTWVTLDAPLVQLGGLTATLLNSQANPDAWRPSIEPTTHLYSWAMNNHWGTNYRAYQEGPTLFRYVVRPHRGSDLAEASRFATGFSQPVVAAPARGPRPSGTPLLTVSSPAVLVTALKPSDDGRAYIVHLFNASDSEAAATLAWADPPPTRLTLSNTSEQPGPDLTGPVTLPPRGLLTVRAERPAPPQQP